MKRDISNTTNFCITRERGVIKVVCPDYSLPEKSFSEKFFEFFDQIFSVW